MSSVDLKLIFLGTSATGKTSLINRFVYDSFGNPKARQTIGSSFVVLKTVKGIQISLWDSWPRGAGACVLTYDVTMEESFDSLPKYLKMLNDANDGCIIALAGTKIDLLQDGNFPRAVKEATAKEFAKNTGAKYFECSNKTGENVKPIFDYIADEYLKQKRGAMSSKQESVNLQAGDQAGGGCGC